MLFMDKTAELILNGKSYRLPITEGTEKERAVDISSLRNQTGYITLDDGYGNTGSCQSQITFIDGETGILRYRGIPIEELAEKSTFIEVWALRMTLEPSGSVAARFVCVAATCWRGTENSCTCRSKVTVRATSATQAARATGTTSFHRGALEVERR